VDPVPDPLLLRKSGSSENRTRTSGYVARQIICRKMVTFYVKEKIILVSFIIWIETML
jgi:hypothetical protein